MRKLNLGCGLDVRDGWINVDNDDSLGTWPTVAGRVIHNLDARKLGTFDDCSMDVILINHVLHMFEYAAADDCLEECERVLDSGGRLVVIDADIISQVVQYWDDRGDDLMERLVSPTLEPTREGRLLRWIAWHGTRRSLWSAESVMERMSRFGLLPFSHWQTPAVRMNELLEGVPFERWDESFVVVGVKP